MTNHSTFIRIDADKGGTITLPMKYTIGNRLLWKTVEIMTSIKTKWIW